MKELSIEEKAKRYDEAIKKAKKELDACGSQDCDAARQIFRLFPELKESEDEKVRKKLINIVKKSHEQGGYALHKWESDEMLAYLEKQGEMDMESYKTAEDEKREFVGDGFIKCYADFQDFKEGETYWLEYIGNDNYNVRSDNLLGKTYHITPCQLYTIFKKQTWLEKKGEQKYTPKHKIGDTIYYNSFGEVKSMIVANVVTDSTDNPMYEDENGSAVFEKDIIEQKSTDKVEPKFKVGDWIINNADGSVGRITKILTDLGNSDEFEYEHTNGCFHNCFESNYHLWTIQDAKDGDVLCTYECEEPKIVFILKGTPNKHYALSYYCFYNIMYPHFDDGNKPGCLAPEDSDVKPATKEQHDLLFQKMKEAGYEADKLELKKINDESENYKQQVMSEMTVLVKDYITRLKDRVQPKHREWKQENIEELSDFENAMMHIGSLFFGENAGLDPNDTNAIKEQANILLGLVTKQE